MRRATLGFLICFGLACGNQSRLNKVENGDDPVYELENEDLVMNAAIDRAKASFNIFEKEWKQQDTANSSYTVKVRFSDGADGGEHMWLVDLFAKSDTLYGVLDNDPVNDLGVVAGDTIPVKKADISDWMYVRNGKLVGGFTLKVLYNRMSAEEKKQFQEELPFSIE